MSAHICACTSYSSGLAGLTVWYTDLACANTDADSCMIVSRSAFCIGFIGTIYFSLEDAECVVAHTLVILFFNVCSAEPSVIRQLPIVEIGSNLHHHVSRASSAYSLGGHIVGLFGKDKRLIIQFHNILHVQGIEFPCKIRNVSRRGAPIHRSHLAECLKNDTGLAGLLSILLFICHSQ